VCVVFYSAYTFPNRKVKSGVGELREGSLDIYRVVIYRIYICSGVFTICTLQRSL